MKHFYQTIGENWFNYQSLYSKMINKFDTGSHFVEVGSWKGRSSCYMAVEIINSKKDIKFDCVDCWEYITIQYDIDKSKYKDLYSIFLKNIEPVKDIITPIKKISWEGAELYDDLSLDFVFIDAAHDYDSVVKDINAWLPKVKKGGVIAGHDYLNSPQGVKRAVDEIIPKITVSDGGCWIFEK